MSLRVISPRAGEELRRSMSGPKLTVDSYHDRLIKLVPAEAIGAYPLLQTVAAKFTTPEVATASVAVAEPAGLMADWRQLLIAWLLLIVVIVLRRHATSVPGRGAQWGAVLIAAFSFVIWVYVLKGDFGLLPVLSYAEIPVTKADKEFVSTVVLIIWTILVPVLYKGDR